MSNSFDARFVPFFWTAHLPSRRGSTAMAGGAGLRSVANAAAYPTQSVSAPLSLSEIVLFALFFVFLAGQSVSGHRVFNEEQVDHRSPEISYVSYLTEGHFVEATFENWESEFLQMFAFVLLTVYLVQRGSPESRPLDDDEEDVDADLSTHSPAAVRAGGWRRALYSHSLTTVLGLLFLVSLLLHSLGGAQVAGDEAEDHGQPRPAYVEYVTGSQFWFESLQNWQSEFLAVGALVVLSIFLREKNSPESKESPNLTTRPAARR